ncbi:MAG TPA: CDP-diacylglycerol--serine O-phosphatidyltransferase [Rhodocyclaceae bacterium]|nr:CDP-diacylglycerol--serine O-phosphatidyltransferase [Rhodocyclaceae bacterium]
MAERPVAVTAVDSELPDDEVELPPRRRRKGIYILPNLFTLGALFGGFYAVVMAMNGRFEQSAYGVFAAMVLDSLDGRIARMTHTQSVFGEHMDSLSDMVSFGAAPALIAYEWALRGLGKPGWIAAFVYCSCAALRLARFNTNLNVVDKRFFQGLPSPAAAALVAGCVWVAIDNDILGHDARFIACAVTIFAGISMVTNVFFYSGKDFNLRRSIPFSIAIAVVVLLLFVSSYPPGVLFGMFVCYALSGYVMTALRWWRKRKSAAR